MIFEENIIQGTDEWKKCRLGIPTSSNFDKIVTLKGEPSKQREKYMYRLVAERITGTAEETYQSIHMQRGTELEPEARAFYEFTTGNDVQEVGICYKDDRKLFACSPDGLVGKGGLIEIKCPSSAVHIGYLLNNELPKEYFQQIQGQLLVTGRKWVDFFSFYPGLRPLLIRIKPDKKFLKALEKELEEFCAELDSITERVR